jgi:hypothetical protein
MESRRKPAMKLAMCLGALALLLSAAAVTDAEVIKGVMSVTGGEME